MTIEDLSPANPDPAASPTDATSHEAEVIGDGDAGEAKPEAPVKTEQELKIEELERSNKQLRRGIDRRTRQLSDERAQNNLTRQPVERNNQSTENDSEPLSFTRAEFQERVNAEAQRLVPTLRQESAEADRRTSVVQSIEKSLGKEKFDEVSSDLDDAFGGLKDRDGRMKPSLEAVFESDDPAKVITYLADPDNADEAEAISRMSAAQAGKAIAKLEAKFSTEAAKAKPKASSAPAPLEAVRGAGGPSTSPDPSDTKAWMAWRNKQQSGR
jgi:hypothetical protein